MLGLRNEGKQKKKKKRKKRKGKRGKIKTKKVKEKSIVGLESFELGVCFFLDEKESIRNNSPQINRSSSILSLSLCGYILHHISKFSS